MKTIRVAEGVASDPHDFTQQLGELCGTYVLAPGLAYSLEILS